jgi:hypothetical protein
MGHHPRATRDAAFSGCSSPGQVKASWPAMLCGSVRNVASNCARSRARRARAAEYRGQRSFVVTPRFRHGLKMAFGLSAMFRAGTQARHSCEPRRSTRTCRQRRRSTRSALKEADGFGNRWNVLTGSTLSPQVSAVSRRRLLDTNRTAYHGPCVSSLTRSPRCSKRRQAAYYCGCSRSTSCSLTNRHSGSRF